MAILQKVRLIAGERIDKPDFDRVQEFVCSDFGQFFNKFWSDVPYILKGFEIDSPRAYIGLLTSQGIQIEVANSVMFYGNASYGGAFYVAPATTEPQVTSLTANSVNYVEFEFTISTGTPDTRKIWDADIKAEFDQIIDTVQYLDIIVTSNTIGFTTGRIPIAKVITNAVAPSVITSITDCRELLFRLGSGGTSPSPLNSFSWPDVPVGFSRMDQSVTVTGLSPTTDNPFKGSDKNIRNLKEWMNAVMTRIKEISGDSYWFMTGGGGGAGTNVADLWWDAVGSKMTGTGKFTHSPAGTLTWSTPLYIQGIVGPYYFKINAGTETLADDEVLYLIQTRNQGLPAGKPVDFYNTQIYVNSNGGLIGDFAGLTVGDWIKNTADGIDYYCRITDFKANLNGAGGSVAAANALSITIAPTYKGVDAFGATAVYAKGTYSVGAGDVVVTSRSVVPNNANVWWLAMREDNTGGNALIYIRDGSELQDGESIEISDETSEELLAYIGAPDEATAVPTRVDEAVLIGSKVAVQNYSCVATDDLTVRDSKLTSMIADKAQDKTISIREGGLFTWDLGTETLSWTLPIVISIPSSAFNETLAAGSQVIGAGECIWFTIDRNAGAVDIRAINVDLEEDVPLDEFTFVLAKRGSDDKIYLMDGTVCEDSNVTYLGSQSTWFRLGTSIFPLNAGDNLERIGALIPNAHNTSDIGTDLIRFKDIYYAGILYGGASPMNMESKEASGGIAFHLDTANAFVAGDLLSVENATVPKFVVDFNGDITIVGLVDGVDVSSIPANYTDAAIMAKVLGAGYLALAGVVTIGDSLEVALEKLDGNISATEIVANAALPKAGGQISGNITCLGGQTFDGVDLSVLAPKVGTYRNLNVVDNVTTDDNRNVTGLASALAFAIDLRSKILVHMMSIGAGAHANADPYSWVYHNEVATVNGTALGVITVADASAFSVDDLVYIDNTLHIPYAVGYVASITVVNPGVQEEIHVTVAAGGLGGDVDLSAYTVALGAHIWLSLNAYPVNPIDLATLITFIGFLKSGYILHDDDAELGAAWLYHMAQEAGDHSINPALPITTLAEVIIMLTEFKTKYDAHVADLTTHTAAVGATAVAAPANGFATTIIDTAAAGGDKIHWSILDDSAATVKGVSAVPGAGFITFTFDADPNSDVILSYSLFRAN